MSKESIRGLSQNETASGRDNDAFEFMTASTPDFEVGTPDEEEMLALIQKEIVRLEMGFHRHLIKLARIFQADHLQPLHDLRRSMLQVMSRDIRNKPNMEKISSQVEKTSLRSDKQAALVSSFEKVVRDGPRAAAHNLAKNFWSQVVLKSGPPVRGILSGRDVEICKHLVDISSSEVTTRSSDNELSFQLSFQFAKSNPFFHNRRFVKRYTFDIAPRDSSSPYQGARLVEVVGTRCDWKLQIPLRSDFQENKNFRKDNLRTETSFGSMTEYFQFNWSERNDSKSEKAEMDAIIGEYFRSVIIPNAFTIYRSGGGREGIQNIIPENEVAGSTWSKGVGMVPAIRSGYVPTPSGSTKIEGDEVQHTDDEGDDSDEEYDGVGSKKEAVAVRKKGQTTSRNNKPTKLTHNQTISSRPQQPLPSTRSESFSPLLIIATNSDTNGGATEARKSFSEASASTLGRRRRFADADDDDDDEGHVIPRKRRKCKHMVGKDEAREIVADKKSRSDGNLAVSRREVLPRRAKSIGGYQRGSSRSNLLSDNLITTLKQPKQRLEPIPKPLWAVSSLPNTCLRDVMKVTKAATSWSDSKIDKKRTISTNVADYQQHKPSSKPKEKSRAKSKEDGAHRRQIASESGTEADDESPLATTNNQNDRITRDGKSSGENRRYLEAGSELISDDEVMCNETARKWEESTTESSQPSSNKPPGANSRSGATSSNGGEMTSSFRVIYSNLPGEERVWTRDEVDNIQLAFLDRIQRKQQEEEQKRRRKSVSPHDSREHAASLKRKRSEEEESADPYGTKRARKSSDNEEGGERGFLSNLVGFIFGGWL